MVESQWVSAFSFRYYEGHVECPGVAPYKATREDIARARGAIIQGTERRVLRAELDENGHYRRLATGWGDLS